ncbi:hypothetical protein ACO0LM_22250 [Undibacterium sp. Di26W]|uniref:hypothetical protein n=1 Tax=Undibacterium sp. Di26W TaxID=3413035 RepID=UPI003BF1112C
MAVSGSDDHLVNGEPGTGSPSAGQRSDQPDFAPPLSGIEPDEHKPDDISEIQLGAQAITGKAVTSPSRTWERLDAQEAKHAAQKRETERRAQEARELANLSAWNNKKTTIGGVEMANGDAQKARRKFVADEDHYADEAVKRGYISPDEKEDLKRGMRRKIELQEKEGRGTITDAERREQKEFDQSRIGQAGERVTADIHQRRGIDSDAKYDRSVAKPSEGNWSTTKPDDLFQSAPKLKPQFQDASIAALAVEERKPVPAAPKVQATGLDL